jgi:AcrR family transcriptional regulator
MQPDVKPASAVRTRRARRAEETGRRIRDAAADLFRERGYAMTTIESIAERADVAVETVYSRFGSKANLLEAILGPAIVGTDKDVKLFDLPEVEEIRRSEDQREQIRLLAHLSRTVLERTHDVHSILHTAASSDAKAAELERADRGRRYEGQCAYIEMLLANGSLRAGVAPKEAADTYSTLASPETYAYLVEERGWSAQQFEHWLQDSLARLLLD